MNEKTPNNLENLLKKASESIGTNPENLKNNKNTNINNILGKLPQNQVNKVKEILSDKEATKKLLSTPKAQELLKKLLGK
jgi:hypothetical protein